MSTRNEDNHSDSDSDLEEMEQHMIICMHIYEYWQSYVDRTPLSYSIRMQVAAKRFQRSKDTIHRQFKRILGALCALAPCIIRPQSRGETPSQILNNPKYYPYFEKCIGAIDGTHVAAWALAQKQTSYRGRKILITQNVMCACSFDMMFTFIYMGWEGTANDSRVFIDAVMRPENEFPFPDEGPNPNSTLESEPNPVSEITLQSEPQSSQVSEITLQSEPQS
ncbi:hypothetical protein PRUPE_6G167200 [Prunus persica]|uniref:DDE Tnp4 domain-containing protein n=1 Tax=Prunus persica TaxID=3760 RepID=A0A251NRG9_PRUPE|nr:hypothetical protein PRUPE_6G167200 [Prunus persica]